MGIRVDRSMRSRREHPIPFNVKECSVWWTASDWMNSRVERAGVMRQPSKSTKRPVVPESFSNEIPPGVPAVPEAEQFKGAAISEEPKGFKDIVELNRNSTPSRLLIGATQRRNKGNIPCRRTTISSSSVLRIGRCWDRDRYGVIGRREESSFGSRGTSNRIDKAAVAEYLR
ncbi:hypothetical protein BD779DRAFT_1792203 [Infundibulicybe gibba]|nr:hypothetical protein BD779DRAFT_1792203 [Infundibulicybe gibba]